MCFFPCCSIVDGIAPAVIRGEAGLRLSIKEGSETLFILVLRVSSPTFSNLTKNTGCVDGGEWNLNEITSTTPLSSCLSYTVNMFSA